MIVIVLLSLLLWAAIISTAAPFLAHML